MNIVIRNTGDMPIYEQIVVQIKQAIVAGELTEGEALPSMRLLAKELRISVITTKRAYEELERDASSPERFGANPPSSPTATERLSFFNNFFKQV